MSDLVRPSFESRLRNELGLVVDFDDRGQRWRLAKPGVEGTFLLDRTWVVENGTDKAVRRIGHFFRHVSGELSQEAGRNRQAWRNRRAHLDSGSDGPDWSLVGGFTPNGA